MGYDIHITRNENWVVTGESDITLDEWIAYAKGDKDLELMYGTEIKIGEKTHIEDRPGYCEWNSHPTERNPDSRPWFDYWKGNISTKNPDTATIRKMLHIASALNAKVQGDDGELYTENDLPELEKVEKQYSSSLRRNIKPWWKFW